MSKDSLIRFRLPLLLGAIAVMAALFVACQPGNLERLSGPASESYYNLLARSLRHGHLWLERDVPAGLAALPDPHDPRANEAYRNALPPLHDLSYYDGKLYLYFGVVPAAVLYLPCLVLTGRALPEWAGVWLFSGIGVLALLGTLDGLRSRYFPTAGLWAMAGALLGLAGASGLTFLLVRADAYEVAIAGGFCFTSLGLAALARAAWNERRRAGWLLAAGVSFGLALGCRANLVLGIGAVVAGVLVVLARRPSRALGWRWAACLVLPLAGIGIVLLSYNQARFGAWSEFGQRYQLSALDHSKTHTFALSNLAVNGWGYVWQVPHRLEGFPYLDLGAVPALPAGYDAVEDPFPLLLAAPFLLLSLLGLRVAWTQRGERPVLAAVVAVASVLALVNAALISAYFGACSRYEAEVAPYLGFLAGVALLATEAGPAAAGRWAFRALWGALLVYSIAAQSLLGVTRWAHARCDYAVTLLRAGQTAEAERVLMNTRRDAGAVPSIPLNLGYVREREGRFAEAAGAFSAAAWIEPEKVEPVQAEVDAWLQGGDYPAATAAVTRGLVAFPGAGGLHARLAFLLGRKGDLTGALKEYALADAQAGLGSPQYLAYGFLLVKANRLPEAAQAFAQAVRRSPDEGPPRAALGTALAMLGRFEEASVQLSAALTVNPNDSDSRDNLVEALERLGRPADAARVRAGGNL